MGRDHAAISRPACRRLSRFVAVFCAPVRIEHRRFSQTEAGIPPSPSHLTDVIGQMKAQKIKAIIVEPYHDRRIAEKVARSTGAKVVDFSQFPGGIPGTDSYVRLIDVLVSRLADALK